MIWPKIYDLAVDGGHGMPPLDFCLRLGGQGKHRSNSSGSKFQFHEVSLGKHVAYDNYVTFLLNTERATV